MTTNLPIMTVQPWYVNLIDELKDIVVEHEFASRWALVEGYHTLGTRILSENDNFEREKIYGQGICNAVAISLQKRPRTIYYAVQFARMYPDLNLLDVGKNLSWHHIVNKYLTDGKDKPVKLSPTEIIRKIKELLQHEWEEANQAYVESLNDNTLFEEAVLSQNRCDFIRYLQDQIDKIIENSPLPIDKS